MTESVPVLMEDVTYYDDNITSSTPTDEDDVRTLAASYLMYKIGELLFCTYHYSPTKRKKSIKEIN